MSARDTYKYVFKEGNRIVHCGRTRRPLDLREAEHQRAFGLPNGHIVQVGYRTTWEAAGEWERESRCSPFDRG